MLLILDSCLPHDMCHVVRLSKWHFAFRNSNVIDEPKEREREREWGNVCVCVCMNPCI